MEKPKPKEKEKKPRNGNVTMKNGKTQIYWIDKWNDFNINFIEKDMKRACRGLTPTAYVRRLYKIRRDLKNRGLFAIKDARKKMEIFKADKREGIKQLQKLWDGWLNQINMYKNIKTTKIEIPTKNFRDNFDKIFNQE